MARHAHSNTFMPLIRLRLTVGLLIVATAALPFFASWHEASVQHVACAEHGQITHASAPHDHNDHGDHGNTTSVPGASLRSEEHSTPADEHGHCDISFVVQGRADGPRVRAALRFTPPSTALRVVEVAVTRPGRHSVLASAPKTSPPTV